MMRSVEMIRRVIRPDRLGVVAALCLAVLVPQGSAAQETGRISGVVTDGSTGRPVVGALVEVVGTGVRVTADVEGRFRTAPVPAGPQIVQVGSLGYSLTQVEDVVVTSGGVVTLRVVLTPAAVEIEGLTATVAGQRESTAAGLLAVQKNAATVMDGLSAEQMALTPDASAADAISRVTGVSLVDDKFVVVRGLAERYNNTLLNGVEIASPEPTRRIVPLDIFPAALLNSIVTSKTASPDMPGSFAGGSVSIETKDFPEERVFEVKLSQGYNSLTTFEQLPVLPRSGIGDYFGFDGADRTRSPADLEPFGGSLTRFMKSVRPVWTPGLSAVRPDFGFAAHFGDQVGEFERALGYVLSVDYGFDTSYQPDNYFALIDPTSAVPEVEALTSSATTVADWGALANATMRLGTSHMVGIRNLFTRESEELAMAQFAVDTETQSGFGDILRRHQVRYIERTFLQSQLEGQHRFEWPMSVTLEWNATASWAKRDEPENRTLTYVDDLAEGAYRLNTSEANEFWYRFLDDRILSGGTDVSVPFDLLGQESLFKTGGNLRRMRRDFDTYLYNLIPPFSEPPDGFESISLPPELVVSPENLGRNLLVNTVAQGANAYFADDEVLAAYGMVDLSLPAGFRLSGGLRMERWTLDISPGDREGGGSELFPAVARAETDLLWSANLTKSIGETMNLRAAGYRTISRPDPREIAPGRWTAIAGQCDPGGNPNLTRAEILNGDLRWEWYPEPGEVISVSGFYKYFADPFVEVVGINSLRCQVTPRNARNADNLGAELEIRKGLGFLSESLESFALGVNFTYVTGSADLIEETGVIQLDLPLQDQSPYLVNTSLSYQHPGGAFSGSVLFNYFDDRVSLYGVTAGTVKTPDIVEQGRATLDFKMSTRLRGLSFSLSGKNLTNQVVREVQQTVDAGDLLAGFSRPGVSFSLSVGYAF